MTERTSTPRNGDDFDADLDALTSGSVKKGPPCTVAIMFETHPDPAKAERIRALIEDKAIQATRIAEFCVKHGGPRPAKDTAIRRHRNRQTGKGCGCPT